MILAIPCPTAVLEYTDTSRGPCPIPAVTVIQSASDIVAVQAGCTSVVLKTVSPSGPNEKLLTVPRRPVIDSSPLTKAHFPSLYRLVPLSQVPSQIRS